jgi:phosphate transport system permease protein
VTSITVPRVTELTAAGSEGLGGIAQAIVGTGLLIGMSTLFAVPMGLMGGIYLAEFSGSSKYAELVRFLSDVLSATPSILLGYLGFIIFVSYFGWGFSALAGSLTLAFLMLPYILRTTEHAIKRVPISLKEAAVALGSTESQKARKLSLKLAMPGILTGILLSISISLGETAPLIYTASFSNHFPLTCAALDPSNIFGLARCPVGYLTYVVFVFANIPFEGAQSLAYLAAFLLLAFTLSINLVARIGLRRFSKI